MKPDRELSLPPGYRMDTSDPDIWTLRRARGWIVARFSAFGAAVEEVERAAWDDHRTEGEEEHP